MTATFDQERRLTSWGRVTRSRVKLARPRFRDELAGIMGAKVASPMLGIGLGRSYGDSGLNSGRLVVDMTALDRIVSFDRDTGLVEAEAGLSLSDLIRIVLPHGYFPATTPGTRFVTLGGAVANDVHGKNHHRVGTFGCSVMELGLVRSDRGAIRISQNQDAELFAATVGGLGLTGLISTVRLQLRKMGSAFLEAETIPFRGIPEFLALAAGSGNSHEHTVAWVDCTSGATEARGLFSRANDLPYGPRTPHDDRKKLSLPFELPGLAINPVSLRAFNALYYAAGVRKKGLKQRVHYAPFHYPLDAIGNWNLAYGRRGFYQYQCVVPMAAAESAMTEMLRLIARSGQGSCLAVIKTFGAKRSPGLLSFPFEGATLALDFPNRETRTLALFERLDRIVMEAKGRLYPAKDGRMSPDMFRAGYPEWERFRAQVDPRLNSDFWRRMTT